MAIPPPVSPYVITVKYTPTVTGCHNICFKLQSYNGGPADPEYCCYQDVAMTPVDIGVEQTVLLDAGSLVPCPNPGTPITPVTAPGTYFYNGYVQPCCAGPGELIVPWPNPAGFVVVAP